MTYDAACDGDLPAPIEARSVTWAPDNSAVAFSLGSSSRFVDSDIYLFEVSAGVLHNLTDDDVNGTGADPISDFLRAQEAFPVDVFPAWSPDSASLLFARTTLNDEDARGVTLMTIPRDGGEPLPHTVLDHVVMFGIAGPMHWREDGSIVLATSHPNPTDTSTAIRMIDTDGTMSTLVDGSAGGPITDPVIASMSADGSVVSAWSRLDFHEGLWAEATPIFFHVDIETGTATPWNAYPGVDLPEGTRLLAPPVFGPDDSVAFLWRVRGGDLSVSVLDASGAFRHISEVAYTPSGFTHRNVNGLSPTLQWADDGTLLVILATGGSIIPPGQFQATPAG